VTSKGTCEHGNETSDSKTSGIYLSLQKRDFAREGIYGRYSFYVWHAVAQLIQTVCYKPGSRGFVSLWCHWNVTLT